MMFGGGRAQVAELEKEVEEMGRALALLRHK
jgi:hypothetical protein